MKILKLAVTSVLRRHFTGKWASVPVMATTLKGEIGLPQVLLRRWAAYNAAARRRRGYTERTFTPPDALDRAVRHHVRLALAELRRHGHCLVRYNKADECTEYRISGRGRGEVQ